MDKKDLSGQRFCDWCGQLAIIVWVHGHGQCSVCGTNVDECCRGESCQDNSDQKPSDQKTNRELPDD
ncbi:MAG: hypothetical protein ACYDA4_08450 [Ignavibacteriaceae bacterium]